MSPSETTRSDIAIVSTGELVSRVVMVNSEPDHPTKSHNSGRSPRWSRALRQFEHKSGTLARWL